MGNCSKLKGTACVNIILFGCIIYKLYEFDINLFPIVLTI